MFAFKMKCKPEDPIYKTQDTHIHRNIRSHRHAKQKIKYKSAYRIFYFFLLIFYFIKERTGNKQK